MGSTHQVAPRRRGRSTGKKTKATRQSLFSRVAAKVGVTPAAVTLALQDSSSISTETKERVFWASRQLGYRRSRVRVTQHLSVAAILGVANPGETFQNSSNVGIWEGLSRCAEQHEMALHTYGFRLNGARLRFEDLPILLRRDQLDGVAILGVAFPALLEFLRKARVPTVVASNFHLPTPVDQVRIDLVEAARRLTRGLLEHGHRHVGFLTGGAELMVHQQLYRGFEEVMREHGVFNPALVHLCKEPVLQGIHPADVLLQSSPRPTAVFAAHWHAACQVAFAANRAGIPFDSGFELGTPEGGEKLGFIYPVVRLILHSQEVGRQAIERIRELHQSPRQEPKTLMVECSVNASPATAGSAG